MSDTLESMTHMFHAACADLGAINEALGLNPDDGGAEPILMAIEALKLRAKYAETGTPVAYFVNGAAEGHPPLFEQITDDCKDEPDVFPLYAAAPAPAAPVGAMTDEQIEEIAEQHWSSCRPFEGRWIREFEKDDLLQFARAIAALATAARASLPQGFRVKRVEGHGWIIDPPSGTRWVAFEGTPAGELMQALDAATPVSAPVADGDAFDELPVKLHPDTAKLVRRFARAIASKLLAAQRKYGYGASWTADDWHDKCRVDLMKHIAKGDPRDVAAYCAFMWHHDWSTAAAPIGDNRAGAMTYPEELTPDLREVLGWICFQCAPIAHAIRAAGVDIKTKAEDEQAHVLHWLTKLVLKHGADWRAKGAEDIKAWRERAVSDGKGDSSNA